MSMTATGLPATCLLHETSTITDVHDGSHL